MSMAFQKLFDPISIRSLRLKNRIAMAPMGIDGMTDSDGSPTHRAIDYYFERVKSGVGLIITSYFKVENDIDALTEGSPLISQRALAPLGELCEAAHSLGSKVFVQLTAGFGRVAAASSLRRKPVSASAVPYYWDRRTTCRPLTTVEVERIVRKFGTAAEMVATAGVDGIELHGHEGYLFDQFTSAIWNKRSDKYGGSLEGRLRFPIEVLRKIKARIGNEFVTEYRFGLKHYMKRPDAGALSGEEYDEAGRDIEEGLRMAELLEAAGFDALHVDAGCYESWYWAHPPTYLEHGCLLDMAAKVKGVVTIPVIAVGRLDMPELAEKAIEEGKADILALGRGLLADPHWPVKVQEGRTEDIRPCIGCHDGCIGRLDRGKPLSCAVNPTCGRERLYRLTTADKSRRVSVVGGGLAGMEAARVAAIRGHEVTLYEKEKSLGGHLAEASVPNFKRDLKKLLQWYEKQLAKLEINMVLSTEVSPAFFDGGELDVLVIATGSKPVVPDFPRIEKGHVMTSIDVLLGKAETGDRVVVVGGGLIGCETALWLAQQGRKVIIVEMLSELMIGGLPVPHMNRIMLLNLLDVNNIEIVTEARVKGITGEGVGITKGGSGTEEIRGDTVVLSLGLESNDELYKALEGTVPYLYAVGDCREPQNIMNAIWDGHEVGRVV